MRAETTQTTRPVSDDERWLAIEQRNASFDGQFVFGVSSTGIFCKPSCPSRRPRRDRVTFFSTPIEAERAGFRACLRCRPAQLTFNQPQVEMVAQVCAYLDANEGETHKLADLAKRFGVSPFSLQRTFKNIVGISPRQYAAGQRISAFKDRVKGGQTVTTAMYEAGFNSSSRLYESAGAELGMTPATYGRGGRGAEIKYTVTDSLLGRLLVAITKRGVCSVKLADSDDELVAELHEEFPLASIEREDIQLAEIVSHVLRMLSNQQPVESLPLDVRSTAFQRQVWEELRSIPYGETRSYGDIAEQVGNPKAVRAVGRACATNPVALVIPCHRVVREDKTLGGYRWGLQRKQKLLELEGLKGRRV